MHAPADPPAPAPPHPVCLPRPVCLLLNIGHAVDHWFLLIFATAVVAMAQDFSLQRWEDLMPFGTGAFVMFGLGSVPAGQLGDRWGRRPMMVLFFAGMGASALLVAAAQNPWHLATGLTLLGLFSAIYHPVGIPMLVQGSQRPGAVIGLNGLAGNLGVAGAALITGSLVQLWGWRAAFALPGLVCLGLAAAFARLCPAQDAAPARRPRPPQALLEAKMLARALLVMTAAAIAGTLLFNFTTNGNPQFLAERFAGIQPASIGMLLAGVYALAALSQVVVGRLIDRLPFQRLYFGLLLAQAPCLVLAALGSGWWLFAGLMGAMVCIFGCAPFTDAMVVRYVDDSMRSRVAGVRLALSFGISSLAVWLLGPAVKSAGFTVLFLGMAAVAVATAGIVLLLPAAARQAPAAESG